jgi:hypothetical protein
MVCIDLKKKYGHRYVLDLDEAAGGRWSDPWYHQIVCRHGRIGPHGGDRLVASTNGPGRVARRLLKLSGVEVLADGDDGANVIFPVQLLTTVARVMRPRSRRKPSAGQVAALARARESRKVPAPEQHSGATSPSGKGVAS